MNTSKRFILALLVAIVTVSSASAQFRFGVKAGLNVNKLHFNEKLASADNSCGWNAGVMTEFTVPIIGICLDASLMYSRMNNASDVKYNDVIVTTPGNPNGSLGSVEGVTGNPADEKALNVYGKNFIEIPINLKYKFSLPVVGSIIKPYLYTGPCFAFRLDKKVLDPINNIKSKAYQVAWNVGLGVELIRHLQIGASYGFGINNVVSHITDLPVEPIKAKNNYWTVSAAYLF